jgi:hypothetical protein
MSVHRRFAASSGRLPLACLLGLLLAVVAVLLLPTLALAFVSSDEGGCLCQSPQPPGDSLTVVAFLGAGHGWLVGGPVLVTSGCRPEAVTSGAETPQGCTPTAASVGRPPPPGA